MTMAHELAHAFDCALGGGIYRSGCDARVRSLFTSATENKAFINPYASTGLDEYFAEAVRAFIECNDPGSAWPDATRTLLQSVDPGLFDYISEIFTKLGSPALAS